MIILYLIFIKCDTFVLLHLLLKLSPATLSLRERINLVVPENKEQRLNKFKSCLIQRGYLEEVLNCAVTKLLLTSLKIQNKSTDYINFVQAIRSDHNSLKKAFESRSDYWQLDQKKVYKIS